MALSKMSTLGTAQHILECGIENCERNREFYCNPCHQPMCKQCRDEHLRSPETKYHEVVLYQLRKRQLPKEKCKIHPTKDIELLCKECQVLICSTCTTTSEHRCHTFTDSRPILEEMFSNCQGEMTKIYEYFLPTSKDLQKEICEDLSGIKILMDSIRSSTKAEAENLKCMVDTIDDETLNDYITYLNGVVEEFATCVSSTKLFSTFSSEEPKIQPIPETTKPITPEFTTGQYNKEDVVKLLGYMNVPNKEEKKREIRPMIVQPHVTSSTPTSDHLEENIHQKSVSPSVTKVRDLDIPSLKNACHLSIGKSGKSKILWISDQFGNLVQTDLQGNQLQKRKTSGGYGYHTLSLEGDLMFTDKDNKVIKKMTPDNDVTKFIKTGDWKPISIHFSHINGDILVGMVLYGEAKVTRYNSAGKETKNIQRNAVGQNLYSYPHYITENIDGDICTSDRNKGVVVLDKFGQLRFSYTGQASNFSPLGICTDVSGHILVCDDISHTIHLLEQDSQFLSFLITPKQKISLFKPCGMCMDDENNLYIGQEYQKVTVYKYL
ncbi:uncharacterized protein LOC133190999 [Saccostrea echinata]|uniref:uncharacterized protein LOC133190999 n=1 Tax=Saccostrea echinata TaxID=191078 RepID=UPI002A7FC056|nr:uncharacterized protein LOC133190999 [Saccostrea echinata]